MQPHPWDSPGKNTGVGCHFLLQCIKVKSESEVAQSCPTLRDPMDCSLPSSSIHEILQARVLEWGAIAFSGRDTLFLKSQLFSHQFVTPFKSLTRFQSYLNNIHQYDTENVPPGKKYGSCTKERTFFYQKLLNRLDNISLCKSAVISLCWSHLVMKYEVDQIKRPN